MLHRHPMYSNHVYKQLPQSGLGPYGPTNGPKRPKIAQNGSKQPEIAVTIQIFEFKTSRQNTNILQLVPTYSTHAHKQLLQSGLGPYGPTKGQNGQKRPKIAVTIRIFKLKTSRWSPTKHKNTPKVIPLCIQTTFTVRVRALGAQKCPKRPKMTQNGPKQPLKFKFLNSKLAVRTQTYDKYSQHTPNMHTNNFYSQGFGPTDPEGAQQQLQRQNAVQTILAVFRSALQASKTLCGHVKWFIGLPLSPIYTFDQIWSGACWPDRAQKGLKNAKMPPYTLYRAKSQNGHVKPHITSRSTSPPH